MNVKLIDDNLIFKQKNYYRLVINNKKTQKCITINPFRVEHYNDIDLFNIKIYCDIHNIKLKILSTMNYLPVNSQYADELIIIENKEHLSDIYESDDKFSNLQANVFDKNWPNFLETDFYQVDENILNRKPRDVTGLIEKIYNEITIDQLNEFIKNKTVFIRKSTFDIFKSNIKDLPKNIVLAEIKNVFACLIEKLKNQNIIKMPIVGLDYEFQKETIRKVGHHYMGFQILGSIYLNWNIIAAGGSARLFSMLPTRNILLMAKDLYGNDKKLIPKNIGWINKKNFPWIGNHIANKWSLNDSYLREIEEFTSSYSQCTHIAQDKLLSKCLDQAT